MPVDAKSATVPKDFAARLVLSGGGVTVTIRELDAAKRGKERRL